jgi:hypothetical protein
MAGVAALAGTLLRLLHPAVVRAETMNGSASDERSRISSYTD